MESARHLGLVDVVMSSSRRKSESQESHASSGPLWRPRKERRLQRHMLYVYICIYTYIYCACFCIKIWDVMLGVNLFVRGPLLSDSLNSCFAAALTCIATIVMFVKLLKAWHLKPPGWPWKRAKRPN